tara:strand:- start:28 stop:381 length:354 start_codon:yes stop_codon:yes gene_type:complete
MNLISILDRFHENLKDESFCLDFRFTIRKSPNDMRIGIKVYNEGHSYTSHISFSLPENKDIFFNVNLVAIDINDLLLSSILEIIKNYNVDLKDKESMHNMTLLQSQLFNEPKTDKPK